MDERTLTERLERVEQILSLSGFGGVESNATSQRRVNEILSDRAADKLEMHRERAGNSTTQIVTSFEEIMNRILGCTDRVHMVASGLEEIGNRVFGSVPQNEGEEAGAARVKPDGMLEHTFDVLNRLDHALCRLHSAAARIERI